MRNSIKVHGETYELASISPAQLDAWRTQCAKQFPTDRKYQIIYADPPWQYDRSSEKIANQCEAHYPVMNMSELLNLPVENISDKNCALFLWVSNPMLPNGINLVEKWGFVYKTVFKVWRKINKDGSNVMVPGWWSRSSTELLIVATKGNPLKMFKCANHCEQQEYTSTRTQHSEKPDAIRESIENFLKVPQKIELFSRKIVENWDSWGLEVPGFYHEDGTIFQGEKRSIGIQVCIEKEKRGNNKLSVRIKENKGVPLGHKENCKCFVCKKIKTSKSNVFEG